MRTFRSIIILLTAALLNALWPVGAAAQSWTMVNNDTLFINACSANGGVIYDNGGPEGAYSNNFNGWVVIAASNGVPLTLNGSYALEGCCDYITVWDGNAATGTQLFYNCGSGIINLIANSGRITIRFTTDGSVTNSGFALTWGRGGVASLCTSDVDNLTASNIGTTSATLSWTGGSGTLKLDYGQGEQPVSGNSVTLSGLNPNTLYNAKVYADGDADNLCCVAQTTFRTACGIMAAPLVERFDDLPTGEMPACWSSGKNFDEESLFPVVTTDAQRSGTKSLRLSSGGNTTSSHFGMVIGPKMSVDMSTQTVIVSLRSNMSGAKVEVGVCDTVSNLYSYYGFTPMDTLTVASSGNWYEYHVPLSNYTGDGCRLAFRMMQGLQPGGGCIVYIDDLMVESCGVDSLSTYNLGHNDITLAWSVIGSPLVDLTVSGGGSLTVYSNVTSPYHIAGLTPGTNYTLTLMPHCGSSYGAAKSISCNTLTGDTLALQYCEDFESGWPSNLRKVEVYDNYPLISNYNTRNLVFRTYGSSHSSAVLPMTGDHTAVSALKMNFRMRPDYDGDGVVVGVMDYPGEMGSFTPVDTITSNSAWRYHSVDLSGYAGTGRYIALRSYSPTNSSRYIYLDDITIGRCLLTNLTVAGRTHNSVTLEWDGEGSGEEVTVEWRVAGGQWTVIAGAQATGSEGRMRYMVTGLDLATTYQFAVYRDCGEEVCRPLQVEATTYEHHYTVPYCNDFESVAHGAAPDGWTRVSIHSSEPCVMHDRTPHSGTGVLSLYSNGDLTRGHSTIALPELNVNDVSGLMLTFFVYCEKSGSRILEIGVMDNASDESTFVAVDTVVADSYVWKQYSSSLAGYSGTGRTIALRWYYTDCQGCNYLCYLDDLIISEGVITEAGVYGVRSDGATVEWSTEGTVNNVNLHVIDGLDTTTYSNISSPYHISGLSSGTFYRYELDWGICMGIGGSFATCSEALRADWCYDFETGYNNGRYNGWFYPVCYSSGSGDRYHGNNAIYLQSYSTNITAVALPYIEEEDYTSLKFSFMGKQSNYGQTVIGLVSDARDTSGFVPIDTITERDNVWRRYEIDLTGHENDGHHLVFIQSNDTNQCYWCNSWFDMDDLRLDRGNRILTRSYTTTSTTATILWEASAATDSVRILLLGSGSEAAFDSTASAADGGCTITGLVPGTAYTLHLMALSNSSGGGCDTDPLQLQTLDHDVNDGYCESSSGYWTVLPEGWTWLADGGRQPWNDGNNTRFGGIINAIALHADSRADAYTMAVMPRASVPLSTLKVGFGAWYNSEEAQQAGYLVVGVLTDPADAGTFTALDTFYLNYWLQWFSVDLSFYSGNGRYIAFKAMTIDGYDRNILLTHVSLASSMATRLHADRVTDTSMRISWQMLGNAETWVRVTDSGLPIVDTIAASPLTVAGLNPNTQYTVTAAPVTQTGSPAAAFDPCTGRTIQVTTLQETLTSPACIPLGGIDYTQQANITNLPNGWTRPYGNAYPRYSDLDYTDNIEFFATRCDHSGDMSSMAVSPWFPNGFAGQWLNFFLKSSPPNGRLVVGSMTNPNDTSTFTPHDTIGRTYPRTLISLDLSAYGGNYLAFRYLFPTSCNDGYAYISSLSIMNCPMPNVTFSHQEDTTVWIHWDTSDPLWIEYKLGNQFAPGTGTRILATSSPTVISGLSPASTHTFHFWPLCNDGDTLECAYRTVTLTTAHPPVSIPYCHNFETFNDWGYPDEWQRWNPDGTTCAVTSYEGHDDNRSLHLYAPSSNSVAAITPLLRPSPQCARQIYVNFWTRTLNGSPLLEIGVIPDISDTTSFIPFDTLSLTNSQLSTTWLQHTTIIPIDSLPNPQASFRIAFRLSSGELLLDNLCIERCLAANVEVVDITQHSATVLWEGFNVDTLICEYGPQGFAQGTGQTIGITTSPYTITGLAANTDYNFIFRTVCHCSTDGGSVYPAGGGTGGGTYWTGTHWTPYPWIDTIQYPGYERGSDGSIIIGTSTQAELLIPPYCEDFDTTEIKFLPTGWRRIGGSTPGYPQVVRSPAASGARSLDLYSTTGYSNHVALPPVADPSQFIVSFDAYCDNTEPQNRNLGVLTLGLMSDPDRGSSFIPIDTIVLSCISRWQRYYVDLTSTPYSDHQYIALRFVPRYSSYHLYIDNFYLGSCAVTSSTVDYEPSTATYQLYSTTIGNVSGILVEDTSGYSATLPPSPSSPLPGLTSNGHYHLTVRAYGDQDTQSLCHLAPIVINPVLSLPYCENFDNVSGTYPDLWTLKHLYNDVNTMATSGFMQFSMNQNNPDVFLLPPLAGGETLGLLHISYDFHANSDQTWNSTYSYIDFGYLTDTSDYTSFVVLATGHTDAISAHISLTLPPCSATRLAIRARSSYSWHVYDIDNLLISRQPFPSQANTESPNIGHSQKSISWNEDALGTYWQYEWGHAGFVPGNGTTATSDSCTLTLSNLLPETDYDIYFIDSLGRYACQPYRFVTPSIANVPYCENFDSYNNYEMPPGWSRYAPNTDGHPMVYDHHLDNAWSGTQMWVLPEFNIPFNQLTLHFMARAGYTSDRMIVGFVHDRNNPSDFEGYDTVQLTVTDQWVPVTVDLSRYNGDRRFLAIRFWGSYYFYVDDVVVDPIPPLSIVPISSNAITVTTTTQQPSNPAQTPFYIEILPTGLPQGTGRVVRIDTFPSIIDSLTPNTTYDIFARIDSLATTCAPPQTVTMPQLLALPYCEQFDGYGDCYNCRPSEWTYSTSNDDQNYTVNYNNWSLRFYSYYSNTYSVYASLPDIDIEDIRDLSLEMRYRFENAACTAEIGLVRSPGEWSTFVPIDTLQTAINRWYTLHHDLSEYTGNYRFLAIRMQGVQYQSNYLYIDYIRLQSCPIPDITLAGYNTIRVETSSHSATQSPTTDYWLHITDGASLDSLIHIVSNPQFITDLATNTTYSLTAQCDTSTRPCSPPIEIATSEQHSLPYCEQFDSYGSCSSCFPSGWYRQFTCNDDQIYTTSSYNYTLFFRSYYYNQCTMSAVMPDFNIDSIRNASLEIRYRFDNNSCPTYIGIQTDPNDLTTFTPIHQLSNTLNTWHTEQINLSSYNGDGRYIAIQMTGNNTYYKNLYIDYINIQPIPLVYYSQPQATSIQLNTHHTSLTDYWLHYTLDGSNDTIHLHILDSTYLLQDLATDATYHLLATPDNSGESCWPWVTITTSHLQSMPYCEGFADYGSGSGAYMPGWKRIISDGSNDRLYIYNNSDGEDNRTLRFYNYNAVRSYAVLPEIDVTNIADLTLRVKMWQQGSTDPSQYWLELGVMDDMNDTATFVSVDTLQCLQAGRWEMLSASLASYSGRGRFLALRMINTVSNWRSIYLDRIELLDCDIPADLNVSLTNANTAQITAPNSSLTTQHSSPFYVEYGPTGFTPGSGTVELIDIIPYDIPLNYSTSYDFYFLCHADTTTCLPPQSLTTLAPPMELSYCEDFDSYSNNTLPTNWLKHRLPQSSGNDCYIYSAQNHTPSRALRFYSSYTDRHPYAVLPVMETDSLSHIAVSFWMRNPSCTNFRLVLGAVSDPYDMSTFVPLHTFANTENNIWQRQQAVLSGAPPEARWLAFRFDRGAGGSDWLYIDDLYFDTCGTSDLRILSIESESITLDWNQTGTPDITIELSSPNSSLITQLSSLTPPYTLTGLDPLTNYNVVFSSQCAAGNDGYCTTEYTDSVSFFTPAGGTGCIDPTNLAADYVTCFTGSYSNPYSSIGVVDYGAASAASRHTVHFDTNERDARTGNQLRTIPEGAIASVRLGNWGTHKISNSEGGEAEAITYALYVDTMAFDLLIMKYAAVMQDPMHAATDQPRFRLELLDSAMNLIDPICGAADFIANQALGWNTYGAEQDILWKDWTTVGLDMSAYAGQTVYIRLTTYDCNEGSHYGYAYFTLGCMRKSMTAQGCGQVANNVFTAPSGFAYRWYNNQDTSTAATSQSINIATNNNITYYCNLSFIDNPTCQFTMSAFAGSRYPMSLFDSVVTIHDCQFDLSFNNLSTISMDGINPVGSGEGVEIAHWNFGNGTSSDNYHASTTYTEPGTYTIQLVTAIAGGVCVDTLEKTITLAFPPTNPHIEGVTDRCYGATADTIVLLEASTWSPWSNNTLILAPAADTSLLLTVTDSNGCSHTLSHTIFVHPVYDQVFSQAICDGQTFLFQNDTLSSTSTTQYHLSTANYQCDSLITLNLTVNPNTTATVSEEINETQLPYTFNGTTFTDSVQNYDIHISNIYNCDSIITYNLNIIWNDKLTILDSTVCDNIFPISWNGLTISDSGSYSVLFAASHGEDSTVTLRVHTMPTYNDTIPYSICDNQQYTFEDSTYYGTDAGLHPHLLHTATYNCDSLRVLSLDVRATTSGDTLADHCDHFSWYGTDYTASTNSPTHLSSNSVGCDSVTTLHLTIRYSTASSVEETIVENNLPYTFNGVTFTDSSDLTTVTIPNAVGCDSVISYTLHVDWNTGSRLDSNICFNQLPVSWNNVSFDTTTANVTMMRTVVIPSSSGSDSTIIMRLHVRPIYNDTIPYSICDNQQYTFEDSTYYGTDAGFHPHLLHTATYNCDSLRVLSLDVRATTSGDTLADHCDHFSWYSTDYTASTDSPTHLSSNSVGCDSTTTLHLTIRYSTFGTETDTIVENQLPYTYHGATFADSISHFSVTFSNSVQCDSIVDYTLFVYRNVDTTLYDTLCNSSLPHTWNGVTFDTTLSQMSTLTRSTVFTAHTGADSIITMHLTVHPLYDHHTHTEICDNQTYLFGDSTFAGTDGSTVHLDSLLSQYGCDSLSTLHLTVHPTFDHHTFDTICSNQNVTFTGESYNLTGIYPHVLLSVYNCDSLSTLHLQVWPAYDNHTYDTVCDDSSRFFIDSTYRQTGDYPYFFFSAHACDSLETLHLKVHPTYDLHLYDTIYDGDHYSFEGTVYDTTGIYPHLLQAFFGCDSLRTLHLQRNRRTYNDSVLCQNHLPLQWNGVIFRDKPHTGGTLVISDSVHLSGLNGIDSLVVMTVYSHDTSATVDRLHGCDSLTWQDNQTYTSSTTRPFVTLTNTAACDSVIHLALTIDSTHWATDHQQACDSMRWIDNQWYYNDITGPIDTIRTVADCDSIVTLSLIVHRATYEESVDTFCFANTYNWRRFTVGEPDPTATTDHYLTDTLHTIHNCDSVLAIRLTQMAKPQLVLDTSTDCQMLQYRLSVATDMPYWRWWAEPADPAIDGLENANDILVTPEGTTEYNVLVDYHRSPLCPLTGSLTLRPIEVPKAELKVNPEALTLSNMELDAYDLSREFERRDWYIDWQHQNETSRHLHHYVDNNLDSVIVALRVFNGQCYDTATRVIQVLRVTLFAPNAFTPGRDDNSRFIIVGQGILEAELHIYNREGLLVYHTNNIEQGWDGSNASGAPCPQGSYVWKLSYKALDRPTSLRTEIGTVLLIR